MNKMWTGLLTLTHTHTHTDTHTHAHRTWFDSRQGIILSRGLKDQQSRSLVSHVLLFLCEGAAELG